MKIKIDESTLISKTEGVTLQIDGFTNIEECKEIILGYELTETEQKAYLYILNTPFKEVVIRNMPHQLQGAVGKLISKGLCEIIRKKASVVEKGLTRDYTRLKTVNWVKIVERKTGEC
mgnify:CR=1 FL=1